MSTQTPPAPNGAKWSVRTTDEGLRLLLVSPAIAVKREHLHIGLVAVGGYVEAHSRHRVRVLDFMVTSRIWRRRLREVLDEFEPDVVGMYLSSPYFPAARRVAAEIRQLRPQSPILAGGHHATLATEEVLSFPAFDMAVSGEGEIALLSLLDTLASGGKLDAVPGLCWREGDRIREVPRAPLLGKEEIPTLDWSLCDEQTLEGNYYFWGIHPVMASRGCPNRCSFCSVTNIRRLYPGQRFVRYRDPSLVIDEIEADRDRFESKGMRVVYFYDLNFLLNLRWLRAFTDEYKRRGLHRNLPWSAYTRADHVGPEALECLKDSGCVNLRIGIEAGNPQQRNALYKKDLPDEKLAEALRGIKAAGISVTGYFMIGSPGERPEWMRDSLNFVKHHGVDYPVFLLFQPVAGADILDEAERLGSSMNHDSARHTADLLHGVRMHHRHVAPWQLQSFLFLTQVLFGTRLVGWQLRRDGWKYLPRMARYMARAIRSGFTPFGAFTYYVYYGYDHPHDQLIVPARPQPGLAWRTLIAATRLWMPDSGEPPLEEAD